MPIISLTQKEDNNIPTDIEYPYDEIDELNYYFSWKVSSVSRNYDARCGCLYSAICDLNRLFDTRVCDLDDSLGLAKELFQCTEYPISNQSQWPYRFLIKGALCTVHPNSTTTSQLQCQCKPRCQSKSPSISPMGITILCLADPRGSASRLVDVRTLPCSVEAISSWEQLQEVLQIN